MSPPTINSTNSVSTSKKKRDAERSVNWTVEETQVLLCAWSDERIQKCLAENLRNRHVFKHLSVRMSELGFSRSPHQCRLRVKTLKANYVRAKQQRSADPFQLCSFKYFAEMDAVLGRRSLDGAREHNLDSEERMARCSFGATDMIGNVRPHLGLTTEIGNLHSGSSERTRRQHLSCSEEKGFRQTWQPESEVKLEDDREELTDEFEFSDTQISRLQRDRCHDSFLESTVHHEPGGTPAESNLSTPPPITIPPPSSAPHPSHPPLPQHTSSPLPPPPDPSPSAIPTSSLPHTESPSPDATLRHLSECFQHLVSETRGLLVQLEGQRQEEVRRHQELLAHWLEKEERRQREAAEREERREKARMEHEIRVLELLTSLARERPGMGERGCRCGGVGSGSSHISKDGN